MRIQQVYVTDDGKQFPVREDARRHEVEQETIATLRTLLKSAITSELCRIGNVDNVLRLMLMEQAAVSAILSSYRKKMPQEKKATLPLQEAA